jgi:nitrate/nitrite transport system substrate-binding protein
MRRWGQIPEAKTDDWYVSTAKQVYRPEIYRQAAKLLIAEGKLTPSDLPDTDGFKPADGNFIDGVTYDGHQPNAYLRALQIGLKD